MNFQTYLVLLTFLRSSTGGANEPAEVPTTPSIRSISTPKIILCFEDTSGKIRTFANLIDYQKNSRSFDPQEPTYEGNVVQFSMDTIDRLSNNDFISFGSNSIIRMDLHHKAIKFIDVGTFKQLFCLNQLDLSYNQLVNLTEGSFEGLGNLKHLNLSHNNLTDIPDNGMAFMALESLRILDLSHNKISKLSKLSFMTLYKLESLNLGHNEIKTLDDRVFNDMFSLKYLYLNDNLMVEPSAEKWKNLGNLTELDLSNNFISSFDTSENYSFVDLERLNLSGNRLQYLNTYGLRRNFRNLKSLDLSNNNWFCEDLEAIKHHLIDARIVLPREITCSEIKTSPTKGTTTTTTPVPTTSTRTASVTPQINYGAQLVAQNKELMESDKALLSYVESLRSMITLLFVLLALVVVFEVGARVGVFRNCYQGVGRNDRGYLDSNDVETMGLISR